MSSIPCSLPTIGRFPDRTPVRQRHVADTFPDEAGAVQDSQAETVMAESGAVTQFLFELYKNDANPRYLQAALKGLSFVDRDVVPNRKWFDFETFWSCSPKLVALDDRTRQWPANNLALIHTVDAICACRTKSLITLNTLRREKRCWIICSFTAAGVTNPVLDNLTSPVMLLGGFTTQNSDGEWSDARQSLAGDVILRYYRVTGKSEYLERGVEALRSQFPISPSENWAHKAYGGKAVVSSFHWGTGSGLAGIEMHEAYLFFAMESAM